MSLLGKNNYVISLRSLVGNQSCGRSYQNGCGDVEGRPVDGVGRKMVIPEATTVFPGFEKAARITTPSTKYRA
jgi:hypothetical protein